MISRSASARKRSVITPIGLPNRHNPEFSVPEEHLKVRRRRPVAVRCVYDGEVMQTGRELDCVPVTCADGVSGGTDNRQLMIRVGRATVNADRESSGGIRGWASQTTGRGPHAPFDQATRRDYDRKSRATATHPSRVCSADGGDRDLRSADRVRSEISVRSYRADAATTVAMSPAEAVVPRLAPSGNAPASRTTSRIDTRRELLRRDPVDRAFARGCNIESRPV